MHLRLLVVLILAVTLSGGAGFVLGQSSDRPAPMATAP